MWSVIQKNHAGSTLWNAFYQIKKKNYYQLEKTLSIGKQKLSNIYIIIIPPPSTNKDWRLKMWGHELTWNHCARSIGSDRVSRFIHFHVIILFILCILSITCMVPRGLLMPAMCCSVAGQLVWEPAVLLLFATPQLVSQVVWKLSSVFLSLLDWIQFLTCFPDWL